MKPWQRILGPLLLLAGAGCAGISPEQRQMLDRSLEQYQTKRYKEAEAGLSRFLSEVKNQPEVAEACYVRGLTRLQLDQLPAARSDFEQALNAGATPALTAKVQVALGNLDTLEDHPQEAIAHYAAAMRNLPLGPPTDQTLYWMGVNQQAIGQWMEASLSFSRLLSEYHSSPLAEKARERLRHQAFTIRLGEYRDLETAQRKAEELRKNVPEVEATAEVEAGRPVAAVQTGSYRTLAEAKTALESVRKTQPQARIVPGESNEGRVTGNE